MNVTVDFNANAAIQTRVAHLRKQQRELDVQVVKDSNYFCPHGSTGDLKRSALKSKYGSGEIEWDTPYARYQYYGVAMKGSPKHATSRKLNYSKDENPNARAKWFEEAKAQHRRDWLRIARG